MKLVICAAALLAALAAGCSSGGDEEQPQTERPTARALAERLGRATDPGAADFPAVRGRTLQEIGDEIGVTGTELGLATSVFTPGRNRLAFGVISDRGEFVYGPTAIYVARTPGSRARGPYPAPADLLVTEPPFRSRQAATEEDPFAAVYEANGVRFSRPGRHAILAVTQVRDRLIAAPATVNVVDGERSPVPAVGERAPRVETDTVSDDARGDIGRIETRLPPDDMHERSFDDVFGQRPVALLFATPQLCQSRVCGPVVDIAQQLKQRYGDSVEFIHQEVYVDNDPQRGLREPLQRFGLPTEPWLFTVDQNGRIAARLEGSFGLRAFERAVQAALD
jgi:hypothetical protein